MVDVSSKAQLIMPGAVERAMNDLMDRLQADSEMANGATGRGRQLVHFSIINTFFKF